MTREESIKLFVEVVQGLNQAQAERIVSAIATIGESGDSGFLSSFRDGLALVLELQGEGPRWTPKAEMIQTVAAVTLDKADRKREAMKADHEATIAGMDRILDANKGALDALREIIKEERAKIRAALGDWNNTATTIENCVSSVVKDLETVTAERAALQAKLDRPSRDYMDLINAAGEILNGIAGDPYKAPELRAAAILKSLEGAGTVRAALGKHNNPNVRISACIFGIVATLDATESDRDRILSGLRKITGDQPKETT